MQIKFENVGGFQKTWVAEYPHEVSLEAAAENEGWWLRQLRGVILSSPDWAYNAKDNCVDIFAGWRCVGTARIERQEVSNEQAVAEAVSIGAEQKEASNGRD